MQELILKVSTQIVEANIQPFAEQAKAYLERINTTLSSDEDFAQAESDAKELKALEAKTRQAIEDVANGNADVEAIISTAKEIAEQFREKRLLLEKLVKSEKEVRKNEIIQNGISTVYAVIKTAPELPVAVAYPLEVITQRLNEVIKGKRTIESITAAANAETAKLSTEIQAEIARQKARAEQIPQEYIYLFADKTDLIAGNADIATIVAQRIEAEQARKAEEAKRAEELAAAKAEAETKAKIAQEQRAIQQQAETSEPLSHNHSPDVNEIYYVEIEAFKIIIHCDLETAKTIAREIKDRYPQAFNALKKGE